jgi:hypothetical protein
MQIYVQTKDSFDWLSALTTVLSVVLGAGLAYAATNVLERRKRRNERIAKATLLALKFRTIVDGIFKIDRQLREGMSRAAAAEVHGPSWTQFEEISAIGDYEEIITVEDMSVLAEGEHYDLIEEITEMRDGHNGVVRALVQVFRLREELAHVMPPNQIRGQVASFEGTLSAQAAILIVRLTTLSDSILRSICELKEQARKVAPEVHRKLKASLKVKKFLLVTVPEGNLPTHSGTGSQTQQD